MYRRSEAAFAIYARFYSAANKRELEAKGVENFTSEDHLEVAEAVINRYVPDGTIKTEDEYLQIKAQFREKIEAGLHDPSPAKERVRSEGVKTAPDREQAIVDWYRKCESYIETTPRVWRANYQN